MWIPALCLLALALPAWAEVQNGQTVYETTCITCHGEGKLGAPRLGDKTRWQKLVREGLDDLVPAALRGIRKMPAKGGNAALSDIEVASAVVYMANAGGGEFSSPTLADAARWRTKANRGKKH